MPPFNKMALPLLGTLLLGGLITERAARAQATPPPVVREETRHAETDFAAGGIRQLSANWYACTDQARNSRDANAAERCVVYGDTALLLGGEAAERTPWMRHLTADIVAPGQLEMLEIMGIPEGPRQAWLDRYQRWVAQRLAASGDAAASDGPDSGAPDRVTWHGGNARSDGPGYDDARDNEPDRGRWGGDQDGAVPRRDVVGGGSYGGDQRGDLAQMADGKYPREALRQPGLADALRQLVGPELFAHLTDYSYGGPMAFNGRFTVGSACSPRECGMAEVRYVISPDDVWVGIVEGRRLRIYGDPPRPVRALLLRDGNQTAWRGIVDDMTHAPVPRVVRASVDPMTGDPPLRMTISPRSLPAAPDPGPVARAEGDTSEIRMHNHNGAFEVPVTINGAITAPFAIDSGASDVSVSGDVMRKLMQSGSLSRADFRGKQVYHLADGSAVSSETFMIHALRVGDREVHDVLASVTNDADSLLLGQSFLQRFKSWSIDNQRQVLLLK